MNKVSGINITLVQQIWRSHCLQPHQMQQFKLSNDRCFADNGAVALLRSGYALAARGHGAGKA